MAPAATCGESLLDQRRIDRAYGRLERRVDASVECTPLDERGAPMIRVSADALGGSFQPAIQYFSARLAREVELRIRDDCLSLT